MNDPLSTNHRGNATLRLILKTGFSMCDEEDVIDQFTDALVIKRKHQYQ